MCMDCLGDPECKDFAKGRVHGEMCIMDPFNSYQNALFEFW